jgi:Zn-dependent protease with chaperone function
MELPAGMRPRVHFFDLDAPNAFATLGGHIVVTDDLYRRMPSENALAFVLAHEIAHVEARDPIAALGGGALLTLGLVLIGGSEELLAPYAAVGVQRGFSQRAERRADAAALEAVRRVYGHAGDAAAVFRVFAAEEPKAARSLPSLFDTHPRTAERIETLTRAAADWNPATQPLRPLNPRSGSHE